MVLVHTLQDLFEVSCKIPTLSLPSLKENQLEIKYLQTTPEETNLVTVYNGLKPLLPFASSASFEADIIDWRCLTTAEPDSPTESPACKTVYEVTLNIEGSNYTFNPGDTIGIIAQNEKADVDAVIENFDLASKADQLYTLSVPTSLKGSKIQPHIPIKSTIRHVLTHCCDIRSVLKKLFLLALSRYTKNEDERKILEYLCSKEGSVAYSTYILNQKLCILDLLSNFKSCKPPIQLLFAYLPRLLPRAYSIVNSSMNNPNVIKICFSVMDLGNNRKGLVTGWLQSLIIINRIQSIEARMESLNLNGLNTKVPIFLRKNISGFRPPKNLEIPLILIGPGTGVAPFIGFLEERHYLKEKTPDVEAGSVWLFFGCRNPNLDFIYEKEINVFLENRTISKLSTSFSRIENSQSKYIQEALLQHSEEIVKLIDEGALIYVCGDLKNMEADIKVTLVNCLVKHGDRSQKEAEEIFSNMQVEKRYLVDFWS